MGLDCYIVHGNDRDKPFTHEDDDRIKNVRLCGGLFSGGGSDGSFRGKVYEPIIQELSKGRHTWYIDQDEDAYIPSVALKEQADLLAELIQAKTEIADEEGDTYDDDTIIYTTGYNYAPHGKGEEFTLKEIRDLETLLRVAAERRAVMTVWY
jgi:hypothetical protein